MPHINVEIAAVTDVGYPLCVNTSTIYYDQSMVFVVYNCFYLLIDQIKKGLGSFLFRDKQNR